MNDLYGINEDKRLRGIFVGTREP